MKLLQDIKTIERKRFYHSLYFPMLFNLVILFVKLTEIALETSFSDYGIHPQISSGLPGIFLTPFIHADWSHLYSNIVPFTTLSVGLFYFYHKISYRVFFSIYLFTGILVWIGGRDSYHIGASGIVYGLAAFIFFSGILRRDTRLIAISLITVFLYGSMIWGILPLSKKISWESHLFGALVGIAIAIYYRKHGPQRIIFEWEKEAEKTEENISYGSSLSEPSELLKKYPDFEDLRVDFMNTGKAPKPYNDYTTFIKTKFNERVQKISINAGFTCPNRDGTKGSGGCTYCNNQTFNPFYCQPFKSISQQLTEGIKFFAEKYKSQKYLAYFQAYTNTYAPIEQLSLLYNEALSVNGVIGLVIATRADAVNEEILNLIAEYSKTHYVVVEYGVESTNNTTLDAVNRCHTWEESAIAITETAGRNIYTGAHLILGLPGESRNDMLAHAEKISQLPLHTLKLHQLQIVKGTKMYNEYYYHPEKFNHFTVEEYIELVIDFMELLDPRIIVERFISESPKELLVSPNWGGIKNFEFVSMLEKRMFERQTRQGRLYKQN